MKLEFKGMRREGGRVGLGKKVDSIRLEICPDYLENFNKTHRNISRQNRLEHSYVNTKHVY